MERSPDFNGPMRNPMILLGYVLGAAMLIIGLLILLGVFTLRTGEDSTFSTVFGLVLALFGVYRIVVTQSKQRQALRESRGGN